MRPATARTAEGAIAAGGARKMGGVFAFAQSGAMSSIKGTQQYAEYGNNYA